jgi:hypothetical protein
VNPDNDQNPGENSDRYKNNYAQINECKNVINEFNSTRRES